MFLPVESRIRTPWRERRECPRAGDLDGPLCTIEIFEPFRPALLGVERHTYLGFLYWMDRARHDLETQAPHGGTCNAGTFSLRWPLCPNRLASSIVRLVGVHPDRLVVPGLELSLNSALLSIKITACTGLDGAAPFMSGSNVTGPQKVE